MAVELNDFQRASLAFLIVDKTVGPVAGIVIAGQPGGLLEIAGREGQAGLCGEGEMLPASGDRCLGKGG